MRNRENPNLLLDFCEISKKKADSVFPTVN